MIYIGNFGLAIDAVDTQDKAPYRTAIRALYFLITVNCNSNFTFHIRVYDIFFINYALFKQLCRTIDEELFVIPHHCTPNIRLIYYSADSGLSVLNSNG